MNTSIEPERLLAAYKTARGDLLAESEPAGHWVGGLSSSATNQLRAVRHGLTNPRGHSLGISLADHGTHLSFFTELISRGNGFDLGLQCFDHVLVHTA